MTSWRSACLAFTPQSRRARARSLPRWTAHGTDAAGRSRTTGLGHSGAARTCVADDDEDLQPHSAKGARRGGRCQSVGRGGPSAHYPANGGTDLRLWLRLSSTRYRHVRLTLVFWLRLRLDGLRRVLRRLHDGFLSGIHVPSPSTCYPDSVSMCLSVARSLCCCGHSDIDMRWMAKDDRREDQTRTQRGMLTGERTRSAFGVTVSEGTRQSLRAWIVWALEGATVAGGMSA